MNGAKTEKGMYHIDCYQCINVCRFNKIPGIGHDLVRWFVRKKIGAIDRLLLLGDDIFYHPLYETGLHKKSE